MDYCLTRQGEVRRGYKNLEPYSLLSNGPTNPKRIGWMRPQNNQGMLPDVPVGAFSNSPGVLLCLERMSENRTEEPSSLGIPLLVAEPIGREVPVRQCFIIPEPDPECV